MSLRERRLCIMVDYFNVVIFNTQKVYNIYLLKHLSLQLGVLEKKLRDAFLFVVYI